MESRAKLNKRMLKEAQTALITQLTLTSDPDEITKILSALKDIRNELNGESIEIRWDIIIPSVTTLLATVLVLHYEESRIITSKAWSKVKW